VYVRGFLRTYATVLKMEVPRLMADLDAELRHNSKLREPPPLTNPAGGWVDFLMLQLSRLNWRIAVAALAVAGLLLGGYVALRVRQQARAADPLAGLGVGLYQPKNARVANCCRCQRTRRRVDSSVRICAAKTPAAGATRFFPPRPVPPWPPRLPPAARGLFWQPPSGRNPARCAATIRSPAAFG